MPPRRTATVLDSRIAEKMVSVLDYVSRVTQAVKDGNGDYLRAKLHDLERAVASFTSVVEQRPPFDGTATTAKIAEQGHHYVAGRLLFPINNDPAAAARRRTLEHAADGLRFNPPAGLDARAATIAARWLREQAGKPQ